MPSLSLYSYHSSVILLDRSEELWHMWNYEIWSAISSRVSPSRTVTCSRLGPFFTYSEDYERWPNITHCDRYCHTAFVTLHGSKDAQTSAAPLTRLKTHVEEPVIQASGMGGVKYINDSSVTCCYPDSKPSPIHPLLCEHPQWDRHSSFNFPHEDILHS